MTEFENPNKCAAWLYKPYTNARDYLYAELKIQDFLDWENATDPGKRGYNPCIAVRHEPGPSGMDTSFAEMRRAVPPRADGRKIAVGNHERHEVVRKWLPPGQGEDSPYLRNCPLWEGDIYLERLRAKHTDAELEDLFVSFWQRDKLTWSESTAWNGLPNMEQRLFDAEEKVKVLEAEVAALKKAAGKPEILRQSAMQMVIAITLISRGLGPDASFQEIHDAWKEHAEADAAEAAREDEANAAGGAAVGRLLGSWISAGMPEKKMLCVCLEPGCPTFRKVYKKGRGFVDRYALEQDEETARQLEHSGACGCLTPEMCPSYRGEVPPALDLEGGKAARPVDPVLKRLFEQAAAAPPPPMPPPRKEGDTRSEGQRALFAALGILQPPLTPTRVPPPFVEQPPVSPKAAKPKTWASIVKG